MQTEIFDQPPPIPGIKPEWYYVQNGSQRGPVTATELKSLLSNKTIDPETQVWRTGLGEWKSVRETELADIVQHVPPPISPTLVRNGLVWTVAVLPLLFGIIDASIAHENQMALARTFTLGFPAKTPIRDVPPGIYTGLTMTLCFWDSFRLKKAGYQIGYLPVASLITPVYLFLRAKKVTQRPTYAIAWLVTFVVGLLLVVAVSP